MRSGPGHRSEPRGAPREGLGAWPAGRPPWLQTRDLLLLGYLLAMGGVAWGMPERSWDAVCRRLARVSTRLRAARTRSECARIDAALGRPASSRAIAESLVANHHRDRLHYLRVHGPGGWRPRIRLAGCEHLDAALDAGTGAVLWQAPMVFASLITKRALHDAGYALVHLSRTDHGISRSRVGGRWLNRVVTGPENRLLAERLVMRRGRSAGALRALSCAVRANRLVSIAASDVALRTGEVSALGGRTRLSAAPAGLAWRTGAPLLPVFSVRLEDGGFLTAIEPPLETRGGERAMAVERALRGYARTLESYVRRWPDQYSGWDPA